MTTQTVRMSGEDFVKKVLAGERDYRGIVLEGFNLSGYEGFQEMQAYLKSQDLEQSPIDLSDVAWIRVKAEGLYLPYVKAERAYLRGAHLWQAYLREANLWQAYLREANLWQAYLREAKLGEVNLGAANLAEANLDGADLEGANLGSTNLGRTNLMGANLDGTDLRRANLKGVVNLEKSINLQNANFYRTRVTEKEKKIIEDYLKNKELFVVE